MWETHTNTHTHTHTHNTHTHTHTLGGCSSPKVLPRDNLHRLLKVSGAQPSSVQGAQLVGAPHCSLCGSDSPPPSSRYNAIVGAFFVYGDNFFFYYPEYKTSAVSLHTIPSLLTSSLTLPSTPHSLPHPSLHSSLPLPLTLPLTLLSTPHSLLSPSPYPQGLSLIGQYHRLICLGLYVAGNLSPTAPSHTSLYTACTTLTLSTTHPPPTLTPHTHPSHPPLSPIPHTHPHILILHPPLSPTPHTQPSYPHLTPTPLTHPSHPHLTSSPHTHPSHPLLTIPSGFVLFVLTLQKDLYSIQFSMVTALPSSVTFLPVGQRASHHITVCWQG